MASQIAKVAETIKIVIDSQLCKQSNQILIQIFVWASDIFETYLVLFID